MSMITIKKTRAVSDSGDEATGEKAKSYQLKNCQE